MPKKIDKKQFLINAKKVHGDRYIYTNVDYVNYKTKVKVTCRIHGDFLVTPKSHCLGKSGCPTCGIKTAIRKTGKPYLGLGSNTTYRTGKGSYLIFISKLKNLPLNIEKEFKQVHGNSYTYTFTDPIKNRDKDKVLITCSTHGPFTQTVKNHLLGQGCPDCGKLRASISRKVSFQEFLSRSNTVHNNFFTYNTASYRGMTEKVDIVCPYHGIFSQLAISHVRGTGCPKCSSALQGSSPKVFKDIPTLFYVLRLTNDVYKIGITTKRTVDERYSKSMDKKAIKEVLFCYTFLDGFVARTFELALIKHLKAFNYKGESIMAVKTAEMFVINPTDIIQQLLKTKLIGDAYDSARV